MCPAAGPGEAALTGGTAGAKLSHAPSPETPGPRGRGGAAWAPTSPRTVQASRTTDGGDRKGRAHLAETRGRGDGEMGMRGAGGGRGRKDPEAEGHAECPRKVTTAPVADGPARAERAWGALGGQAAGAPLLQAVRVRRHQASGWWVDTAPRVRLTGAGRACGRDARGGRGFGPGLGRDDPECPCAFSQVTIMETESENGGKGHWCHRPGGPC